MNIHEYQGKQLLKQYGVAVPDGEVCKTPAEALAAAERLVAAGHKMLVVKSQIHAGGRGKGTFKSGFKGGVKLCKTAAEAQALATAMLGNVLVTKQTGPDGRLVSTLLVAGALPRRAARPRHEPPAHHGQHRGRRGHRGSRREVARKNREGAN
jgi:succinyl-CoA synthetase beta subunit